VLRAARKDLQRIERALDKLAARDAELQEQMAAAATDAALLTTLTADLAALRDEREELEAAWMEASEALEG
jgi:ATP-binding cassette subfamily F protein uup